MRELLEHGSGDGHPGEGHRSQGHKSHVADGGVGHQLLDVFLSQRHEGSVDDGDHRNYGDDGHEYLVHAGKHGHDDPEEAVASHLKQQCRQHHRSGCGSLDMGIRQPGMEGEGGHLDQESQKQPGEDDVEQAGREYSRICCSRQQSQHIEGPSSLRGLIGKVQGEYRQEHHQAGHVGVDEELDSCIVLSRSAP